ncbi:HipA domain-containing protein [Gemmatimonas sp.]|uniref:HipA domain-containing protein n=1 Tax=Gemmatimonas sp. TaxID=1962908 RepID=UPI003983C966
MEPGTARSDQLLAVVRGNVMGVVVQAPRTAALTFTYDTAWQDMAGAFPLSLSMPLQRSTWSDRAVRMVLGGWIPDRAESLERIAAEFHVAPDNPFAILGVIGQDCPGAVQFVQPEHLDDLRAAGSGHVAWLTESELAVRLRALRTRAAPDRLRDDKGRFSLPGQQPKVALVYEVDEHTGVARWGVPDMAHPTTHIIKPPMGGQTRFLTAEHFSLRLAAAAGLPAAETFVVKAEDQVALAVVRFDRVRGDDGWIRVHQEDMCQTLGWSPQLKFESSGGPGVRQIVEGLRTRSQKAQTDVDRFLLAVALNWIIVGTDAHARNYSVLIGAGGGARLAPLYDIMSGLAIAQPQDLHTVQLAMRVGDAYRATDIKRSEWRALAVELGDAPSRVEALVHTFAQGVATAAEQVAATLRAENELPVAEIGMLESRIVRRARRCVRVFGQPA